MGIYYNPPMKKLLLLPSLFIASLVITQAQPGTLDVSFDTDGIIQTHISGFGQASGNALVIQPDGKIVTGGPISSGGTLRYVIARYNTDGSLDNTFGTGGIVNGAGLTQNNLINCLALQSDGKIVAAGYLKNSSTTDVLVLRLNTNGTYDTGFDSDGWVTFPVGTDNDEANGIALQTDGKIVVGGELRTTAGYDLFVARLNSNGSLDNTFSGDGKDTLSFGGSDNRCEAVKIQDDGKILVAGNGHNGYDTDLGIARYMSNGSRDNTFGSSGKVLLHYGIAETIKDLDLEDGGKILACGYIVPGGYFFMRLNTDGSLDNTLDSDGIVQSNDANSVANAILWQSDGGIMIAGATFANGGGTESDMFLRRYHYDGNVDNNYGTNGVVYTDVNNGEYDAAHDLAQQADLKLVASGRGGIASSPATDVLVTRYLTGLTVGTVDNAISQSFIYPNPIRGQATLEYELANTQEVSINLYSLDGKLVQSFNQGITQQAGKHKQQLSLSTALPSGNYLLDINAGDNRTSVRVVVGR